MKGFFHWLKNLSTKQTVILVGLAMTMYLHFSQGLALALTQGQTGALFMSLGIWVSILVSISLIGLVMLLLIYICKVILGKIKSKRKRGKSKS